MLAKMVATLNTRKRWFSSKEKGWSAKNKNLSWNENAIQITYNSASGMAMSTMINKSSIL